MMSDEQRPITREDIEALPDRIPRYYGKLARGEGEADPEYLAEQAKAPEPTVQRMDIGPSPRTLINMQREHRSIE